MASVIQADSIDLIDPRNSGSAEGHFEPEFVIYDSEGQAAYAMDIFSSKEKNDSPSPSWSRVSLLSRRDRGREAAPVALRFMELGCGQLDLCTEKPARMFSSTVTLQVTDKTREISMTIEKLQNRCKIKKVIELRWLRGFRCSVTIYFPGRVCRRGQRVAIMWLTQLWSWSCVHQARYLTPLSFSKMKTLIFSL